MLIDQLTQAATLFALGMGTIFVLLSLLISGVSLLSAGCAKFCASSMQDLTNADVNPQLAVNSATGNSISDHDKAIVFAAVHAHRQAKGL